MILHWILNPRGVVDVLSTQTQALKAQRDLILTQQELIAALRDEVRRTELEHTRISRDLIEQFLITLDRPDLQDGARDGLFRARMEFMDHVARLEEQLP
jgi:hypothetical protein